MSIDINNQHIKFNEILKLILTSELIFKVYKIQNNFPSNNS